MFFQSSAVQLLTSLHPVHHTAPSVDQTFLVFEFYLKRHGLSMFTTHHEQKLNGKSQKEALSRIARLQVNQFSVQLLGEQRFFYCGNE